jgi:hypothetical protein
MESIDLINHVTLEVHTASYRSVRGYTVAAAILDEVAFWRSEDSANPDSEIVAALLPAMTTIPGALLLGISSPYSRRGILWDRYQQRYAQEGDPVLVFQAESRLMNPTLSEETVAAAYRDDPSNAAAEYGAEFRSDIEGFLQPEWLDAAVREGVHEIAPVAGMSYVGFTDPSGGANDAFTLGISHNENGRLILDVLRVRRPPFNPLSVCAEFAAVLKSYGLSRVTGDRYSAEFVVSAMQASGVHYEPSTRSTSDVYLEILPHFAQGSVQLLDHRVLLNELRQLERRTGRGKDVISHQPRSHDDAACSACGSLLLAVRSMPLDLSHEFAFVPDAADQRATRAAISEHLADLGYAAGDEHDDPYLEIPK